MSALIAILSRLYRGLVRLYPPSFRADFGAELLDVFDESLRDAGESGDQAAVFQVLRELRDLPGVLIRTHMNWKGAGMDNQLFPHTSDQTPWPAALLSLIPYVILGPLVVVVSYHPWWDPQRVTWVFPLHIGLACLAVSASFIVGAIHKFPRWSYPSTLYLILMLTFLVTYLVNGTPWDINHEGSFLLLVMGAVFALCWVLPPLRPFLANLRLDWTLLSYGMYACALLLLSSMDHDEVPRLNWVVLLPSIIWLAGALAHLRLSSARLRVWVLILSLLLAVSIWWSPVIAGNSSTLAGFLMVTGAMLVIWAILSGLVLAPILIGVITYNRLSKRTPA